MYRYQSIRRPMSVAVAALLVATSAAALGAQAGATPSDDWLKGLTGTHRQFFDSPAPAGGILLVHIMNYYDTYNKTYNVKDQDIEAVGTFYGQTTFHGLNDAMWAKYNLGEFLDIKDGSGKPVTVNPWRTTPQILGMTLPQASIESLQKRGTTFILCNNALQILSGMVAQKRGLQPEAVYNDMKANILPGVNLIPAMVIAVEQAHAARLAYHRQ